MTIVREPFSSQFPFLQRVGSMKSVSLAMWKAEKAAVWQTPETMRQEDSWLMVLLCDGFQESCRYQEPRCGTSKIFCQAGKANTCLSSKSCQSCQLIGHTQQSSSHQSPVRNREHTCKCQAVTPVREPFSSQFHFRKRSDQ